MQSRRQRAVAGDRVAGGAGTEGVAVAAGRGAVAAGRGAVALGAVAGVLGRVVAGAVRAASRDGAGRVLLEVRARSRLWTSRRYFSMRLAFTFGLVSSLAAK